MKISTTLLASSIVEGCTLDGELEALMLNGNQWNKFKPNYSANKHPSGNSNFKLGSTVGRLKKAKRTYGVGESWLRCNGKGSIGKIAFKLTCGEDGSFSFYDVFNDSAVSIADLQDPDVCSVGCDLTAAGLDTATFVERYKPNPLWDSDANPLMLPEKFVGTGACPGSEDSIDLTTAQCKCDMKIPSCYVRTKLKTKHPAFTERAWLDMAELCDVEPPTVPPTQPPTDPPTGDDWSEWSKWTACSADCGEGAKLRTRTCGGDDCEGDATETKTCNLGSCENDGCAAWFGDLKVRADKDMGAAGTLLSQPIFRERDQYGKIRHKIYDGRRLTFASCENDDSGAPVYKTWTCQCKDNKAGYQECKWKNGDRFEGKLNYYYMEDLSCNSHKPWRWADGRRSKAQPAEEVSGGDGWELCEVCYDPGHQTYWEWLSGDNHGDYADREEMIGKGTYGTVVEDDNGKLVCRYHGGHDAEYYYQLSIKKAEMNWAPADRFWGYIRYMREYKTSGDFDAEQMVFKVVDGPDKTRDGDADDWDIKYSNNLIPYNGDNSRNWENMGDYDYPVHRAVCRVNHNGKYYHGSVVGANKVTTQAIYRVGDYINNAEAFKITCVASHIDEDGFIVGTDDNTEYLVVGSDDGTRWGEWSEWSGCAATCGEDAIRTKTRQCLDQNNQPVDAGNGCGVEMNVDNQSTPNMFTDTFVGACIASDFTEGCPKWSWWGAWSSCSQSCGGGTKSRSRDCNCNGSKCADADHPLAADGLCGGENVEGEGIETGVVCDTQQCEGSDGVGPGCKHDSLFTMSQSLRCWDPTVTWEYHRSIHDLMYELNPYGLINHMWKCYPDNWQKSAAACKSSISNTGTNQWISRDNPAQCECHQGHCEWGMTLSGPKMTDCTRGYEWIQSPVSSTHPYFNQIVDFADPSQTGSNANNAITANHFSDHGATSVHIGSWLSGWRMIMDPVPFADDAFTGLPDTNWIRQGSFILSAQCNSGSLKWQAGPYTCTSECPTKYVQVDDISGFVQGNIRSWPETIFNAGSGLLPSSSWDKALWRYGICRISTEAGYEIGTLVKYATSADYPQYDPQPYQCCTSSHRCSPTSPVTESYDVLYSGDCITE